MLPAIGSIVFWIGVMVGAYIVLRCLEITTATGPQERHKFVQILALVVAVLVVIFMLIAYGNWDDLMKAGESGSRY